MNRPRTNLVAFGSILLMVSFVICSACSPTAPKASTPIPTTETPRLTPTLASTPTQTINLVGLIKSYEDAFNRHDIDAVMVLLSPDPTVIFGTGTGVSAANQRDTQLLLKNWVFGLNSEIHHADCMITGDTVSCKSVYNDVIVTAVGLAVYHYDQTEFTFKGDKLQTLIYKGEPNEEYRKLNKWTQDFGYWLRKNYPSDAVIWDTNLYAPDSGEITSLRIKEYAATLPPTVSPVPPTSTPELPISQLKYPQIKFGAYMVYHAGVDRIILMDGCPIPFNNCSPVYTDDWSFDLAANQWTYRTDHPSWFPSDVVYDSHADRLIAYADDGSATYAYDAQKNLWIDLKAVTTPSGRLMAQMAYDSESDKTILFGGLGSDRTYDETWAFDYASATWTKMNPKSKPPFTYSVPMVYDSESDRVIMVAPRSGIKSVWVYDYNKDNWESLAYTDGPTPSGSDYRMSLAYVPELDRVFEYSGSDFYTYDYNRNQWEKLTGSLLPGTRYFQVLAYDTTAHRLVLHGGTKAISDWNKALNDTWLYDPQTGEWVEVGP